MGFTQQAFVFNAESLHKELMLFSTPNNTFDLSKIKQSLINMHLEENNALVYMRYDEEWFVSKEIEEVAGELYLVFLASHLIPCQSLSESHRNNFYAITSLLVQYQWNQEDIHLLIYGDKPSEMVKKYAPNFLAIHPHIKPVLDTHGGWIPNSKVVGLYNKLDSISTEITTHNPHIMNLIEKSHDSHTPILTVDEVVNAYERAKYMLSIVSKGNNDLFLVVD